MFKGLVLAKTSFEARQPSSGARKFIKTQIFKTKKVTYIYVPGDLASQHITQNDIVTCVGIGGAKSKTLGDIPVTCFRVIKVNGLSLKDLCTGKKTKLNI